MKLARVTLVGDKEINVLTDDRRDISGVRLIDDIVHVGDVVFIEQISGSYYVLKVKSYAANSSPTIETSPTVEKTASANLKDYGAKGDGNTNDSLAIQTAIDEVATAGGGTVFVPKGTYVIYSTILLRDRVRLLGEGVDHTMFLLGNGANVNMFQSAADPYYDTSSRLFVGMQDICLHGNKDQNSTGQGIYGIFGYLNLDRVRILQAPENGIHLINPNWVFTSENIMTNCNLLENGGSGALIEGCYDGHMLNVISQQNGGSGIAIVSASAWKIIAPHLYLNAEFGLSLWEGNWISVADAYIEKNANHGIYCGATNPGDCKDIAIHDSHFWWNGYGEPPGTKSGIFLYNVTRANIHHNHAVYGPPEETTPHQQYLVYEEYGSDGNVFDNNIAPASSLTDGDYFVTGSATRVSRLSEEQQGLETLVFSTEWYKTATVTFSPAYSVAPKIICSLYQTNSTTGNWTVYAHSVSSSEMVIRVEDTGAVNRSGTVYVQWRAYP